MILMLIYKSTNLINGACYIGQTVHSLEHRKAQHLEQARWGTRYKFQHALNKYGVDNFKWEILEDEIENLADLNTRETYWINKFNSYLEGYNMTEGGETNCMNYPEVAANHLAAVRDESFRKRHSDKMKEVVAKNGFSDEHRRKISEKLKGNQHFKGKTLQPHHAEALKSSLYKKVKCIDGEGKDVRQFDRVGEAAKWWYERDGTQPKFDSSVWSDKIKRTSRLDKFCNGIKWIYI